MGQLESNVQNYDFHATKENAMLPHLGVARHPPSRCDSLAVRYAHVPTYLVVTFLV